MSVVHEAHWPMRAASELGGGECLEAGALLRAEPAADVFRDHTHLARRQSESMCQLAAGVEHPLRREPDRERVTFPACYRRMRLERRLQVVWRLDLKLDRYVGFG